MQRRSSVRQAQRSVAALMQAVITLIRNASVCMCVHHQQIFTVKQRLVATFSQAPKLCVAIPLARKHVCLQQDFLHASPVTA